MRKRKIKAIEILAFAHYMGYIQYNQYPKKLYEEILGYSIGVKAKKYTPLEKRVLSLCAKSALEDMLIEFKRGQLKKYFKIFKKTYAYSELPF